MRAVIDMDLSEQSSDAEAQIGLLYNLDDLVHVQRSKIETTQGDNEIRQTLLESVGQDVEQCRTLPPTDTPSIQSSVDVRDPASLILDSATTGKADLIVIGTRNLSWLARMFVGSVSSRALRHSTMSTLIVKGDTRPVSRVLIAVQGPEDANRLRTWLTGHPFKSSVTLTILSVIYSPHMASEHVMVEPDALTEQRKRQAAQVVTDMARALTGPHYAVTTAVLMGDPAKTICGVGENHDLIVVSSDGQKGLSRFFMGSVSESVAHQADRSVLLVR